MKHALYVGLLYSKLAEGSSKGAGVVGGLALMGIGIKLLIEGVVIK